jgi:hypothetical protein
METQWYIYGYGGRNPAATGPDDGDDGGTGGGNDGYTEVEANAVDWTDGLVRVPSIE